MGVPAFFRWLSKKYPSIVVHCVEEKKKNVDGTAVPVDTSEPNPNNYEFDNLYLDMNGIIHPCSHPENKPAPKSEAEIMVNIFEYIDRIFSIVRPRKLLYMAIDGVAPRAKMNQQRSRRFRAAKESKESKDAIASIKEKLRSQGAQLPPEPEKTFHFDSNCITPGTDFMDRLAKCLRFYIANRLSHDPGWRNIKVILSDANVPGEGEHKIMDYIRKQRAQSDHDPNTKHCLNGADADLIMLGLATHELNFTILREEFKPNQKRPCEICGQVGHEKEDCEGLPKEKISQFDEIQQSAGSDVEFIFLRLNVLREYLERELRMEGLPFKYDFERALDDWVFMCFFVGNDFLPHLPSLEIREGAIDRLTNIYKRCLPWLGGYLSDSGFVNLKRVQKILSELGEVEDEIFRKRRQFEDSMKRRREADKARAKQQRMEGEEDYPRWSARDMATPLGRDRFNSSPNTPNQRRSAGDLHALLTPTPDGDVNSTLSTPTRPTPGTPHPGSLAATGTKRKHEDDDDDSKNEALDEIRFHEEGWKERYYLFKFSISKEREAQNYDRFRKHVADEYVRGLCWVLRYYFQGCPSWNWFFPFHYAPFASDFIDIDRVNVDFEKGTGPFKPLEQLMSVFPAASGKFLPPTWRELMSSCESPIIDFYPADFKVDLNGKRFAWQGVALLPFVDEKRLHRTLASVYDDLNADEIRRNRRDHDVLFVRKQSSLYDFLFGLRESRMLKTRQEIVTDFSHGMRGKVFEDDESVPAGTWYESPVEGFDSLHCQSFSVRYENPDYAEDFVFPARVLEKATPPERVLKPGDFPAGRDYRPQTGMSRSNQSYQPTPGGHRMIRHELGIANRSPGHGGFTPSRPPYFRSPEQGGLRYQNPGPFNQFLSPPAAFSRVRPPLQDYRGGGHQRSHTYGGEGHYDRRSGPAFNTRFQQDNRGRAQHHFSRRY